MRDRPVGGAQGRGIFSYAAVGLGILQRAHEAGPPVRALVIERFN